MTEEIDRLYEIRKDLIKKNDKKELEFIDKMIESKIMEHVGGGMAMGAGGGGGGFGSVMGIGVGMSGGGVPYANNSVAGMGNVVQPQPSAFPGALNGADWIRGGGKTGSGDVSIPYNPGGKNRVFQKVPFQGRKKRLKTFTNIAGDVRKQKVMNYNDFVAKDIDKKVTKVKDF